MKTAFNKQYLRKAMLEECLSMRALSLKSGVAYAVIWKIMNEDHNPSLATVGKLAKALNRLPANFFNEQD